MKELFKLSNGNKILLRHVKKSDIIGIWNNFNDVIEEGIYLPVIFPVKSQFEKQSWFDNLKKTHEICIVAENQDLEYPINNIVGQCEITNIDWDAASHVGNLGIIVNKKYRDMGIGKKLINAVIKESKKLYNKEKLILSCFSNNKRALNLYKKIGFNIIGVRKKQFYIDSIYYDEVLMELFIDDYFSKIPLKKELE